MKSLLAVGGSRNGQILATTGLHVLEFLVEPPNISVAAAMLAPRIINSCVETYNVTTISFGANYDFEFLIYEGYDEKTAKMVLYSFLLMFNWMANLTTIQKHYWWEPAT